MGIAVRLTNRHNKMDLHKIISLVPGIVFQFRLHPDGSSCAPYASDAVREIYRLDPEEIREDASRVFTRVHPDDLDGHMASIQASARDLTPWQNEYRLKFDDGTVRWLYGNALPQREADGSTLWHGFITDITGRKNSEERLRQSEGKLRAFLDNISDTIWVIDANMNMAYVSPSITRLLGVLPEELVGHPSALVIHPDDMGIITNAMRYVMEHPGEPHTIRYRVGHKEGHWVDVESTGVNLLSNPAINGVLVVMRDITGRKLAENALRESESRYRLLVESSPLCIHEIDLEGRLQSMNRAGLNMLGLDDAKKVCGMLYLGAVSQQDNGRVGALLRDTIAHGTPSHFEFAASGDAPRYFKSCFIPIKDASGKVLKLMGITEDITERKNIEDELKQTKERYDLATAIGKVGTWDWSPVTGDLIWSDETFRLMGLAPGAVKPSYELFLSLLHPDCREFLDNAVQAALRDKKPYSMDCRIVSGSGEELACHVTGKVEFDAKGQPVRMLGTIHDITGRKAGEERLRKSEANLRAILNNSPYLTWLKDPEGRYLKVNKAYVDHARKKDARQIMGKTDFDLWPRELAEKYRADDAEVMASRQQKRVEEASIYGSETRWVETFKTPVVDESGNVLGTAGFARDITERKQAEEQIRNLAFYDALTQLPNRRLLDDRLGTIMAASKRSGRYGALMFLDLDNFKPLNDTHGHGVGDLLLIEAARRITGCVREMDTVARFGGDEFVVMLGELDTDKTESAMQASSVAEKIRVILAEPYALKFQREGGAEATIEHHCTSSIGVALFINHEASPEDILKWADIAMYQAKEGGRNQVRFFDSES